MYTALGVMLVGILCGHILAGKAPPRLIPGVLFCGVLGLLFLLGAQIGANEQLFSSLPQFGLAAAILTASAMAGSVIFSMLLGKWTRP